ncbi:putative C-type lectin [Bacteroides phage PhiCrAssBcn18]|nr:putative C-type lectin [Bacteroides phage PhiCrAssBcn18]
MGQLQFNYFFFFHKMKDIQQLIKKNSQEGRYEDIFPKTFIDAVIDKESGTTLTDILSSFNMYFLSYTGSRETTRLEVPMSLRKQGLWITYVLYNGNTITEWYGINAVDDASWQDGNNWRLGSNMLVGDISISAGGNWIINGVDTGIPARGEKGDSAMLRVNDSNKLQVSYTNGNVWIDLSDNPVYTQFRVNNNKLEQSIDLGETWSVVSDYIAAWFRFTGTIGSSQANNVGKIQISRDNGAIWSDLSGEFTNSLHIKGYVATVDALPSAAVQGDIYGVGPTYDPSDTEQTNPIYQLYVKDSTGWVDNGRFTSISAGVVQELGNSETAVMSQAGVTSALNSNFKRFRGDTLNRPILTTDDAGYPYYDTTIGKYIVWNGGSWVNLDGTSLG